MEGLIFLPRIKILGLDKELIFIQGGMGIGISLASLAAAVAKWKRAIGTVSSAALDFIVSLREGKKIGSRDAARIEIGLAKKEGGFIAINIMRAIDRDFISSIIGAIEGGVDAIICGAGLPLSLPEYVIEPEEIRGRKVFLIPIISSARALEAIIRWWKKHYNRAPDTVILEGPKAGGHLGFKRIEDLSREEFQLENLFFEVKKYATDNGDIPILVAGGIFNRQDIIHWGNLGADGVQMATRFLITKESDASEEFKKAAVHLKKEDIIVVRSPCGDMPFRLIKTSPGYIITQAKTRMPKCTRGYVLQKKDGAPFCPAKDSCEYFCICNALIEATRAGEKTDQGAFFQ
jgi:nitronate monooxygenase